MSRGLGDVYKRQVYRLERLQKMIGLDIRKFEDAMTFKIAMMVIAHMTYQTGGLEE